MSNVKCHNKVVRVYRREGLHDSLNAMVEHLLRQRQSQIHFVLLYSNWNDAQLSTDFLYLAKRRIKIGIAKFLENYFVRLNSRLSDWSRNWLSCCWTRERKKTFDLIFIETFHTIQALFLTQPKRWTHSWDLISDHLIEVPGMLTTVTQPRQKCMFCEIV